VATNQARKDWALAAETVAILSHVHKIRLWIHTDTLERHWSIPALLADYGLLDKTMISLGYLSDDNMAQAYSACNVTLGPGAEGWGLPLAESLACGTPVIHGNYAGGAEITPIEMHVEPIAYRAEGLYACVRPVYNPQDWADRALQFAGQRTHLDPQYDWNNLWPRWKSWLQKGITA
jgi:glycosyltransferase involved in cell wall biosynthesis